MKYIEFERRRGVEGAVAYGNRRSAIIIPKSKHAEIDVQLAEIEKLYGDRSQIDEAIIGRRSVKYEAI